MRLVSCLVAALAASAALAAPPQPAPKPATAMRPHAPATPANPAPAQPAAATDARCPVVALAAPDAAAVDVPSAPGAWGGPRSGNEATLSDRVVRYDIDAELDPVRHTIVGKQKLTWRNRSAQPVCSIYLHLYLNGFEGPGSTFMTEKAHGFSFRSAVGVEDGDWGWMRLDKVTQGGQPARWSFVQPDDGPATDRSVVRIDLPAPVAPGAQTTLDIDFFDQLPRVIARTGYYGSFHLVAQWFPKIGVLELPGERGATAPRWNVHEFHLHSEFYADYGEYDVRITVPKGYTVGATGEETGAPVERGDKVTHRYVQGDVHDFAWTADKRYAKPLEATWTHAGSPPVKVKVLYHPEYASNAQPVLQATLDSLTYFSDTLGPYPYRTVTAVIPPYNADEAGGMEYPTFFTASSFANADPGTTQRALLDFVTIHEFGHGYFYGILGSNEFEEPFLDEGMNEYWDQRMLAARKQGVDLTTPWLRRLGFAPVLRGFDYERLGARLDDPADPLGGNAWDRMSSASYGTVYARTATAMQELERLVGTPALERAMKLYYARWKFRHPGAADLREALAEGTGRRDLVEGVFARNIFGAQRIDDRIESLDSAEVLPQPGAMQWKGQRVALTKKAVDKAIADRRAAWKKARPEPKAWQNAFPYRTTLVIRREGADVPRDVLVRFADGSVRTATLSGARSWQRFSWITPSKAVSAQIDPRSRYWTDVGRLDDSRTLEADEKPALRITAQFGALLQTLLAWMVNA